MSASGKAVLTDELLSWAGVTVQPHRFGGIEFVMETEEDVAHAIEILHSKYERMTIGRMKP